MAQIACKLPISAALMETLRGMSDADAGAALKAALAYQEAGLGSQESGELSAAAQGAYEAMRALIDLSRQRAAAGRAGGKKNGNIGQKRFAPSKIEFAPSKTQEEPQKSDFAGIDVLAALAGFV